MSARRVVVLASVMAAAVFGGCSPLERSEGLARPSGVFVDKGPAPSAERVRGLVSLRVRDEAGLDALVAELHTQASPRFREHLAASEVVARFAPSEDAVAKVRRFAASHGLDVRAVAHNRLLVELGGSVAQFNEAFETTLHGYEYESRDARVFGTPGGVTLPDSIADIATLDAGLTDPKPAEPRRAGGPPPHQRGYAPEHVAAAYRFDALAKNGTRGKGAAIGVVVGGSIDERDLSLFWRWFGVEREDADVIAVSGAPIRSTIEATMDVEWAGALAPEARLRVYAGADTSSTSLLFAFNEAIARGDSDVVTYSYSRHESSEPRAVRRLFDLSAKLGAALGVTVLAASGDTAKPDLPATCPFVTAVAGTDLEIAADGSVREKAWPRSGSGISSFARPSWQAKVRASSSAGREVADVALNAGSPYLVLYEGRWVGAGGTSLAAPVFAAMIANIDGARRAEGRPRVGFLNPVLYADERVQKAFRDVTEGGTSASLAGSGWDSPTGWGAPLAAELAEVL